MCVRGVVGMDLQECMEGWLVVNLGCHSSGTAHTCLDKSLIGLELNV